jgi:hypothetical protein
MSQKLCALSVLQKECRKVWGARYRPENTVIAASTGIVVFWNMLVCGMVHRYALMAWKKIMLASSFRVEYCKEEEDEKK